MTSVTIITGALLNSIKVDAVSTLAQATVNVEEACTMNSTITTPHTATIPNGTYQADIGTTTINVICNDSQGYAIYAVGYTGNKIGGTNSAKLVGPSSSINTGTATSGNTSNWAMKISTSGSNFVGTIDNSFGNYHAVPNEYTKVAHYNSTTDAGNNATGSTYQTTYAAFVSKTQRAGNYAGKVKYTMVHPANEFVPHEIACAAGKICYNPNTAIVEGQMGTQSAYNNASATLYASNLKKQGYGFAGWSEKYDYETNPNANIYGPNETIIAPADVQTNGLSLYAVWIKSTGSLQDWNGCSSLVQGTTTALTDERDGNTYAVAKLADGKCWMIENLRLNDSPILSSDNTHNPSLPLTNSWWFSADNDSDTKPTSNHLSRTTDPATAGWCSSLSANCYDQSMLATNNTTLFTNNTSSNYSTSSNVYSYGNYYNWYSITGGHGKYGDGDGSNYTAPGDICPAGWHLPKGGNKSQESTNEFWQLIVTGINNGVDPANYDSSSTPYYTGDEGATVSNILRAYPNNFVYSGYAGNSSIYTRNYYSTYWSASGGNTFSSYYLYFSIDSVNPGTNYSNKSFGRTARCLAGV